MPLRFARPSRTTRRSPAADAAAPLELLVDAMATYRLTRLATADVIAEPLRRSIVRRVIPAEEEEATPVVEAQEPVVPATAQQIVEEAVEPARLATLVTCRWCAGMWIAGGVVLARRTFPRQWDPLARALSLSAAAALIARAEDG